MANADLVIDIETIITPVTQEDIDEAMGEYNPPANYKNPELIAKHKAKFEAEIVTQLQDQKRFSLEGKRMISCAIGIAIDGGVTDIQSWANEDLRVITNGLVSYLDQFDKYRLVGWNLKGFDLPEISKSFALTKVRPRSKPGKWDIIDLCDYPFKKVRLKTAAKAFGIETIGLDGSKVAELYEQGNWTMIKKYNEDDVRITGELFLAASRLYSF